MRPILFRFEEGRGHRIEAYYFNSKTKIMKWLICLLVLFATIPQALSQNIHLNLYSAYVFPDKFDSYYDASSYYNGQIQGGYQWGGGLEFMAKPMYGIELLYYREDTEAPTTYWDNGEQRSNLDLGFNYIMLGGNRYVGQVDGRAQGYGGLMAGMLVLSIKNPDNNESGTPSKFAWGARLGGVIWASEQVGIKLHAQLLSAVQAFGGGLYFGTGGAGAGVSTYSTIYQFGLGGGLTIRLGQ